MPARHCLVVRRWVRAVEKVGDLEGRDREAEIRR